MFVLLRARGSFILIYGQIRIGECYEAADQSVIYYMTIPILHGAYFPLIRYWIYDYLTRKRPLKNDP